VVRRRDTAHKHLLAIEPGKLEWGDSNHFHAPSEVQHNEFISWSMRWVFFLQQGKGGACSWFISIFDSNQPATQFPLSSEAKLWTLRAQNLKNKQDAMLVMHSNYQNALERMQNICPK
jgi:hypothetical protein